MDTYFEQLKNVKKISLEDAKDLYLRASSEVDESKKKALFTELILRTLREVYEYIDRNELYMFETSLYGLDDMVSASTYTWMEYIMSGKIVNADFYANIFNRLFFERVCDQLSVKYDYSKEFGINRANMIQLLFAYINLRNRNIEVNFYQLVYLSDIDLEEKEKLLADGKDIIPLFESIYLRLLFRSKDLSVNAPITKINTLLGFYIGLGMYEPINKQQLDETDYEEKITNILTGHSYLHMMDDVLDDEDYEVFTRRNGVFDKPETLASLAKEYGYTSAGVVSVVDRIAKRLQKVEKAYVNNPNKIKIRDKSKKKKNKYYML
jgi:hypothetical protein